MPDSLYLGPIVTSFQFLLVSGKNKNTKKKDVTRIFSLVIFLFSARPMFGSLL
jgi:hypothetical protein